MKALMKVAPGEGNFEIRDIPVPEVKRDTDVLIKISAAGICGTDIHILHDKFKSYPPVVIGHEFSGVVKEIGKAVKNVKPGDRVVGEPHTLACGICEMCRSGLHQLCEAKRSPGWGIDGAYTEYMIFPEPGLLHHIPDNIDDVTAVLAEPFAIVTHEVLERGVVEPQDFVVIVGAGPIGILAAVAAKAAGARKTAILGIDADESLRFTAARKVGVDFTINVMREDAVKFIAGHTHGRGADLVVEASGSEGGINSAIDVVRKCGRITVIGLPAKDKVLVKWTQMQNKRLNVYFNLSSSHTSWERALSIMATTPFDLSQIISHRSSIHDWEKVYEDIQKGHAIKAVFIPD